LVSQDMICVYHAADVGQADIIVAWLRQRGIDALAKDAYAAATLQTPLTMASRGVEVCVWDAGQAERAVALLAEHFHLLKPQIELDRLGGTVGATCEECGGAAEFPSAQGGSVQTCPHCRAYVDVPESG
jgi:hypothetical protein